MSWGLNTREKCFAEKSVELRRAEDAVAGPTKTGDGAYKDVDEYDPVLRSHCRL